MIPPDLNFIFDNGAYLLVGSLLILILFRYLYLYRARANRIFDASIIIRRSVPIFWSKVLFLAIAWALIVFAFMQPRGNEHYADEAVTKLAQKQGVEGKLRKRAHEVLIFIDASASMAVTDTNNGQSRLEESKVISDQIIRRLNGENVSLYAFTSGVTQLSPSTLDYLFVRLMLRQMKINEGDSGGTDFMPLLQMLKTTVTQAPPSSLKSAIIFSDGGDYRLDTLKEEALQNAITLMTNQLGNAESEHLRVYTVGLGSREGGIIPGLPNKSGKVHSSLQEEILKKLAYKGRGEYITTRNASDLDIANRIIAAMKQDPATISDNEIISGLADLGNEKIYDLYFQFPLGLALILLAYAFLWPEARR